MFSIACALVALSLPADRLPTHYYATGTAVQISLDPTRIAFEVVNAEGVARVLAKNPGVEVERLFGNLRLISGVTRPALGDELARAGARILATYRTRQGVMLIADGKIRARFAPELTLAEVQRRVKAAGGLSARSLRAGGYYEVLAPSPRATVAVANGLYERGAARWAHPDFIYKKVVRYVPGDPLFDQQWHHDLIGSTGAWDLSLGRSDVIIAIIDSGLDTAHPELAGKIVYPLNALDPDLNDFDPTPGSEDAHGTATAGLAAAVGDNAIGVVGVCPGCSIMPIRIMSETGAGREGADSDAFYWAADHGAQILSNSWGFNQAMLVPDNLNDAIMYAADQARGTAGCLILFASGNDYRENLAYELASHPKVMGIGATDYYDRREPYSNWGNELDLTAPAGSVTTDLLGGLGYNAGDYMSDFGGTSAATPVTAGVAGLVFSQNLAFTAGQVQSVLTATADKVGGVTYDASGFNVEFGHGRVNALRAMQMAIDPANVCQPVSEICDNGVDDDCDALADVADTNCAPDETIVGVGCIGDWSCGAVGYCLGEDRGFPSGYCSMGCELTCADGNVCVEGYHRNYCFAGCTQRADCRVNDGYDCMPLESVGGQVAMACLPSCTTAGCGVGETCDTTTGECLHDGPIGVGGACASDVECADNGTCMTELDWGMPGGYCTLGCSPTSPCPADGYCSDFGWFSLCLDLCLRNIDCRAGYVCWPNGDHTGSCYPPCRSSDDCGGGTCNAYGMCGSDMPPQPDPPPVIPCTCDATYDCDDACDCDPECQCLCDKTTICDGNCDCDPECGNDGCFSAAFLPGPHRDAMAPVMVLAGALALTRRRLRRASQ